MELAGGRRTGLALLLALAALAAWQLEVTLLGWEGLRWRRAQASFGAVAACVALAALLGALRDGVVGRRELWRLGAAAFGLSLAGAATLAEAAVVLAGLVRPGPVALAGTGLFSDLWLVKVWLGGSLLMGLLLVALVAVQPRVLVLLPLALLVAFVLANLLGLVIPAWGGQRDAIHGMKMGWWALCAPLCVFAAVRVSMARTR